MKTDMYSLPKQLEVDGVLHDIRSDFRAVLDIIAALNDPELTGMEKNIITLKILYPNWNKIRNIQQALQQAMWFIACGEPEDDNRSPILYDWQQDFKYIVSPINRTLGFECRAVDYLHWWTFVSAFYEIGDCSFANIVSIRNKLKKGKKLEKWEWEYYHENRKIIDLQVKTTDEEQAFIDSLFDQQ